MQKSVLCLLLAASLLSGCATDPYTGESKVSKTAWGAGIGTAVGTGVQVAELENGQIQLLMPSNITFDFDSAVFKTGFNRTLDSVAKVLTEYDKTKVIVSGYTDNIGKAAYNNELSLKRARAVADYLILRDVSPARISVYGYGSQYPIASNATEAGRAQNRRVTITLQQM